MPRGFGPPTPEQKRVRGQNIYSPDQKRQILKIYQRESTKGRVRPPPKRIPVDLGKTQPVERQGPGVVSQFFAKKILQQRDTDFWKKPWGKKKVDLPLPSYLRDFKDADTYLLVPHFAHCRRNVGIAKNAEASEAMMRELSNPMTVPGQQPETHIYGNYHVGPEGRPMMIDLPPRTPLENTIVMKSLAEQQMGMTQAQASVMDKRQKKPRDPKMMSAFVDQLTEAYALCSAHEQMSQEIDGIRDKANAKCGVTLPPLPGSGKKPVDYLKTLLSKSGSMNKRSMSSMM